MPFAPRLGEDRRAHLRDLAVDNGGEFVHHSPDQPLAGQTGKSGTELLAVAQHVERPQPCRDVAEPHGGERSRHRIKVPVRGDAVDHRPAGIPSA